jgi:predicted DNA-binding transcriptional regulator AlpA
MREQTPPPVQLTVTEDPVTGTWTLTLDGHRIEIERAHGFVKVDGTLHHAPFVQGLQDVHELAGEPLAQLATLLPTTPAPSAIPPPAQHPAQARQAATSTFPTQPAPPQDEEREQSTPGRRPKPARAKRTPAAPPPQLQEHEPSVEGDERTVLPTEHAAAYLGLSPKTLETLRTRCGGPPFLKLGRRVVYRKADLDTWLAARVRRSTSDPGQQ